MQIKRGEKQACVDTKARGLFAKATASKLKCAAGTIMHDKRIKLTEKIVSILIV